MTAAAAAVGLSASPAAAQFGDLFEVFVTATDGSGTPDLTVTGSSLPDLIEDLVNAQGGFSSYTGVAFDADISVAGVVDAINITVDPVAGTASLTFTALGPGAPTFVFTGGNLLAQIEQFIQDNLSGQITEFLRAINTLSSVAVTDGSPISTTAMTAEYVFDRFGLHADLTAWERRDSDFRHTGAGFQGRVDVYYNTIDTDTGDGQSVAIAPSLQYTFDENVAVALLFPISYMTIEGSEVFNLQMDLAVPINLVLPDEVVPVGLRVTPFGTLSSSASVDFIAGGLFGGGGVLGTLYLDLGGFQASASAQISFHESINLSYAGYSFDPGVSQQIVKAGFKVTQSIGENFYVYTSFTFSSFLQPAAVDEFITPGAGFGYRTRSGLNISAGYTGDIGNGFNGHQLRATLQLPF